MSDGKVRIHRAVEDDKNFVASRATAQDRTISFAARGVLFYLLSKPGDWEVRPADLQQEGCGKNQVYKILTELIKHHYINRTYHRDAKGRVLSVDYDVYAQPVIVQSAPFPENQEMENPEMENRDITVRENHTEVIVTTESDSENLHTANAVEHDEPTARDDVKETSDMSRNWMFEATGWGVYRMDREALRKAPEQVRKRIGIIVNGSKKRNDRGLMGCFFPDHTPTKNEEKASAHNLILFFKWWREKKPGIDPPGSSGLIWLRYNDYLAGLKSTHDDGIPRDAQGQPLPPALPPRLPPVTLKEPEYDF